MEIAADLVIVGSGLAGLSTALRFLVVCCVSLVSLPCTLLIVQPRFRRTIWLLSPPQAARVDANGKRPKVVILESDGEVGGRTRSFRLPASVIPDTPQVSYGGTWVMLDNDDLIGLSQEVRAACGVVHSVWSVERRQQAAGRRSWRRRSWKIRGTQRHARARRWPDSRRSKEEAVGEKQYGA